MDHKTEYTPRVLMGSNGKPEGDETFACKTCGACVAEADLHRHTNWHALFGTLKYQQGS
jgi:hypothetical protein